MNARGKIATLAALGPALLAPLPASAKSVPPRDTCLRLDGVEAFRMTLTTAVANRNPAMLRPLVDPQVQLDFGGGAGWDELRARLDDPEYALWDELAALLRLGCGVYDADRGGDIHIPYYWGQDLGTDDAFSTFIVTGSAVPLRAARDSASPMIATLEWDVVTLLDEWSNERPELAHIRTGDGREGYVAWDHLRSQVEYRLIVGRGDDGNWRIRYFIAGD